MNVTTLTNEPAPAASAASAQRSNRVAAGLVGAAFALGWLGDVLLPTTPWGINALLWMVALAVCVGAVVRWQNVPLRGGGRWLVIPALLFAALVAGRDSTALTVCNVLAVLIAMGLAARRTRSGRMRVAGLLDYALDLFVAGFSAGFGAFLLLAGIRWKELSFPRWSEHARAIGCGVLIALPLLFVFGALFMAADAAFQGWVNNILRLDLNAIITHLFWIIFWFWLTAGFLHELLLAREWKMDEGTRPGFLRLGIVEIGIALGALNLLFGAFVVVQFRYFFGGAPLVEASSTLTYAEYARRGFFELVTVAALVLPLLLLAHWLLRHDQPRAVKIFGAFALALVLLLFVIMVSALQRMRLYTDEFGLTELRLYTTAFMGWLALVFVWFVATVLRGQREKFAFGALAAGLAVLALLNALNPDDLIVRVNISRSGAPQPFDAFYVASLSADAAPALVAALPQMKEKDRCQVAQRLLRNWTPPQKFDWRTWNWSRIQAYQIVSANDAHLRGMATACPSR